MNVYLNDKLFNVLFLDVRYSNGGLKTRPFGDQTTFDHLNTGLDWYPDLHYICPLFRLLRIKKKSGI